MHVNTCGDVVNKNAACREDQKTHTDLLRIFVLNSIRHEEAKRRLLSQDPQSELQFLK